MRWNAGALRIAIVPLIVGTFAWGWFANAQAGGNPSWSSKLNLKSLKDVRNRMRVPLSNEDQPQVPLKVTLTNGKVSRVINNCEDYLNAVTAGYHAADNFANKESGSFISQCYVLRDLQHVHAIASGGTYEWSRDSLSQLPPLLVVGSREVTGAAEQAEKRGESWQQFDPALKVTSVTRDELEADDGRDSYSLHILARGNFTGGGVEDIAVYGCAVGDQSTWFQCKYFVLSLTNQGKLARQTESSAPYALKPQIPHDE